MDKELTQDMVTLVDYIAQLEERIRTLERVQSEQSTWLFDDEYAV